MSGVKHVECQICIVSNIPRCQICRVSNVSGVKCIGCQICRVSNIPRKNPENISNISDKEKLMEAPTLNVKINFFYVS